MLHHLRNDARVLILSGGAPYRMTNSLEPCHFCIARLVDLRFGRFTINWERKVLYARLIDEGFEKRVQYISFDYPLYRWVGEIAVRHRGQNSAFGFHIVVWNARNKLSIGIS